MVIIPALLVVLAVITPLENGYVSPYPAFTTYDPGTGARVLLIHDYEPLQRLQVGDEAIYRGAWEVSEILIFAADEPPPNPYPADTLVLQTCVEKDGDKTWGRILVIMTRGTPRTGEGNAPHRTHLPR